MKKLTLRIAELAVESFSIAEREVRGGTVRAHVPETVYDPNCRTQAVTGPCDCILTEGADRC